MPDDHTDRDDVDDAVPPVVHLERWNGGWTADDPYADLRADVVTYGHVDPLVTVHGLSEATGIPSGAIVRYVLARWASGGSEALLELGISGLDHLVHLIDDAEVAGTDAARLEAYHAVRGVVGWLRAGAEPTDGDPGP